MTPTPIEDNLIQLENVNNKPWETGYHWDQSTVNKHYQVVDSHSYISPYEQRDHSWNDKQYDVSDEVKYLDNTKELAADHLENLQPNAEHHLVDGRTGVASDAI